MSTEEKRENVKNALKTGGTISAIVILVQLCSFFDGRYITAKEQAEDIMAIQQQHAADIIDVRKDVLDSNAAIQADITQIKADVKTLLNKK